MRRTLKCFAPGEYICTCLTCKNQFIGAKLATTCFECAVSMNELELTLKDEMIHTLTGCRDHWKISFQAERKRAEAAENALMRNRIGEPEWIKYMEEKHAEI